MPPGSDRSSSLSYPVPPPLSGSAGTGLPHFVFSSLHLLCFFYGFRYLTQLSFLFVKLIYPVRQDFVTGYFFLIHFTHHLSHFFRCHTKVFGNDNHLMERRREEITALWEYGLQLLLQIGIGKDRSTI